MRERRGKYNWKRGDSYVGEWKNNIRDGKGKFTSSNGDVYQGDYKKGKMEGRGTYSWANGDTYTGDWLGGNMHGQGTKRYSDGQIEKGFFENDSYVNSGNIKKDKNESVKMTSSGEADNDEGSWLGLAWGYLKDSLNFISYFCDNNENFCKILDIMVERQTEISFSFMFNEGFNIVSDDK
jgi:hypothetical protein